MPNAAGDTNLITVIPASGPSDIDTQHLVDRLRQAAPDLEQQTGAALTVTGATALTVDVDERLSEALPTTCWSSFAVDAFVVRMTLVPAVLALLGERAWWLPRGWNGSSRTSTSRAATCDSRTKPAPEPVRV